MAKKSVLMINCHECGYNENRVFKESISLANNGYQVRCIGWQNEELPIAEIHRGININRIAIYTRKYFLFTKWFTKIKRLIPPLKVLNILFYFEYTIKILFKYFRTTDIVHCQRIHTLPIGVLFKLLSFGSKKLVYDIREYETETYGLSARAKKLISLMEGLLISNVDLSFCVGDTIAKQYSVNYRIPKPKLLLNCPPKFYPVKRSKLLRERFALSDNTMLFIYQGGLTPGRGVEKLIASFKALKTSDKAIVFMGYGSLETEVKAEAAKASNIFFHEAVLGSVLLDYTSSADIGIFICDNTCLSYYYCMPNKFFEFVQAGLPVIISKLHDIGEILDKYKNGIVIDDDIESIVSVIESLSWQDITRLAKNNNQLKQVYCWEQQEQVLLSSYANLS